MLATTEKETASVLPQLSYRRTVDRALLHRRAASEVFITDGRAAAGDGYAVAAKLPTAHPYYGDHLAGSALVDPVLLLECCRQAETYSGHVFEGVDADQKFILRSWSMWLPGLVAPTVRQTSTHLSMLVTTRRRRTDGRAPRTLGYDITMTLGEQVIGGVTIEVGYLSSSAYAHLRGSGRTGAPVLSTEAVATPATVAPELVGRTNPANVLLRDPVLRDGGARATVRLAVDNRSMFDHPQDHLPGMVLTDAAQQLCLLAGRALFGDAPARTAMVGFDLAFSKYAELDAPTEVVVHPHDHGRPGLTPGTRTYLVVFHQRGNVIASGRLSTARLPESADARIAGAA
ncbi:hypothetical protein OG203_31970 [Nocardia sp. NBC_01499]|uniref:AfsA-related hotdog domain-containing protein n=1 Tax=Nocardia sp. NBC_01499 TaxID=2903597 RepID=UPI00386F3EBB